MSAAPASQAQLEMKNLLNSSLYLWLQSLSPCREKPIAFQELIDGAFLHTVVSQIYPGHVPSDVYDPPEDSAARLHNWQTLVVALKSFYQEVLQQQLVCALPNARLLGYGDAAVSTPELERCLLLLLGAAVQCDCKESFIDDIKQLPVKAQEELVENIKTVTGADTVLMADSDRALLLSHLSRLAAERYQLHDELARLKLARCSTTAVLTDSADHDSERKQLTLEVTELRAQLRKTRQEIEDVEERAEVTFSLREELEKTQLSLQRIQTENAELTRRARQMQTLRDELDVAREKALQVERLLTENQRLRERLADLEFFKRRCDDMKEQNTVLEEVRVRLEAQLDENAQKLAATVSLQKELSRTQTQVSDLTSELAAIQSRLGDLTAEKMQLATELADSQRLHSDASESTDESNAESLQSQIAECTSTKLMRSELELQRLSESLSEKDAAIARLETELTQQMVERDSALHERERIRKELERIKNSEDIKLLDSTQTTQLKELTAALHSTYPELVRDPSDLSADSLAALGESAERLKRDHARLIATTAEAETLRCEKVEIQQRLNDSEMRRGDAESRLCDAAADAEATAGEAKLASRALEQRVSVLTDDLATSTATLERLKVQLTTAEADTRDAMAGRGSLAVTLTQIQEQLSVERSRTERCEAELSEVAQRLGVPNTHSLLELPLDQFTDAVVARLAPYTTQITHLRSRVTQLEEENSDLQRRLREMTSEVAGKSHSGDDLVRELLVMKDHVVAVERENAVLTAERGAAEGRETALTSSRDADKVAAKQRLAAAQERSEVLQGDNVVLKTELSAIRTELHESRKRELDHQQKLALATSEQELLKDRLEELATVRTSLAADYASLRRQHAALSAEYDQLVADDSRVAELRRLETENSRLAEERERLQGQHNHLATDFRALFSQFKELKQGSAADASNIAGKYEVVCEQNARLDEDVRTLSLQLRSLMRENEDLLRHAISTSEKHHVEEKAYMEKLGHIQRQKERLEDKILDIYAKAPPDRRKRPSLGGLMKKARSIILKNRLDDESSTCSGEASSGEQRSEPGLQRSTSSEEGHDDDLLTPRLSSTPLQKFISPAQIDNSLVNMTMPPKLLTTSHSEQSVLEHHIPQDHHMLSQYVAGYQPSLQKPVANVHPLHFKSELYRSPDTLDLSALKRRTPGATSTSCASSRSPAPPPPPPPLLGRTSAGPSLLKSLAYAAPASISTPTSVVTTPLSPAASDCSNRNTNSSSSSGIGTDGTQSRHAASAAALSRGLNGSCHVELGDDNVWYEYGCV